MYIKLRWILFYLKPQLAQVMQSATFCPPVLRILSKQQCLCNLGKYQESVTLEKLASDWCLEMNFVTIFLRDWILTFSTFQSLCIQISLNSAYKNNFILPIFYTEFGTFHSWNTDLDSEYPLMDLANCPILTILSLENPFFSKNKTLTVCIRRRLRK